MKRSCKNHLNHGEPTSTPFGNWKSVLKPSVTISKVIPSSLDQQDSPPSSPTWGRSPSETGWEPVTRHGTTAPNLDLGWRGPGMWEFTPMGLRKINAPSLKRFSSESKMEPQKKRLQTNTLVSGSGTTKPSCVTGPFVWSDATGKWTCEFCGEPLGPGRQGMSLTITTPTTSIWYPDQMETPFGSTVMTDNKLWS